MREQTTATAERAADEPYALPAGWRWARLGDVCELNPRRPPLARDDQTATTFVPMSAVAENGRGIIRAETRRFAEVRSGYTYFAEGDVLFAKITPCMQNGKHAVARGLIDGVGFGSTEFHVLRATSQITPEWVHLFIMQPHILEGATAHFFGAVGQQRVPQSHLEGLRIPLPPLDEQRRIAAALAEQMAAVERARATAEAQLAAARALPAAYLRESLAHETIRVRLANCLEEIARGVGQTWSDYRVVGATRAGLAPAKESVGKSPERYKPVLPGTIFYNPMRILLGSIAMIDDDEEPGITSPDYVVFRARDGLLHPQWFYYWLRSPAGDDFVRALARGAVRERMLFRRLAEAEIEVPPWDIQLSVAERLRYVGGLLRRLDAQIEAIDLMPAALLRRAFRGEL